MFIKNISGTTLSINNGYGVQSVADQAIIPILPEFFWEIEERFNTDWRLATAAEIGTVWGIASVVAWTDISVDNTDPANPVINYSGTPVLSVTGSGDVSVDNTDPQNPVVSLGIAPLLSVVAWDGIDVDNTDPLNPTINCTGIQTLKTTILSAALLTANTTPIVVVPAPWAGLFVEVLAITVNFQFGSIAYATNTSGVFEIGAGNDIANYDISAGASELVKRGITGNTILANTAVTFTVEVGDPTAGDSDMDVHVTYRLVTL